MKTKNKGRPSSITQEQRDQVNALRLTGMDQKVIAETTGVKHGTVRRILKDSGVKAPPGSHQKNWLEAKNRNNPNWKEDFKARMADPEVAQKAKDNHLRLPAHQTEKAIELRKEGVARYKIAQETGLTEDQVSNFFKNHDITITQEQRNKNAVEGQAPDYLERLHAAAHTEEANKKRSETHQIFQNTPEQKAFMSKVSKDFWASMSEEAKSAMLDQRYEAWIS